MTRRKKGRKKAVIRGQNRRASDAGQRNGVKMNNSKDGEHFASEVKVHFANQSVQPLTSKAGNVT